MGPDPKVQPSLNLLYMWAVKSHPGYLVWIPRPWTSCGLSGLSEDGWVWCGNLMRGGHLQDAYSVSFGP